MATSLPTDLPVTAAKYTALISRNIKAKISSVTFNLGLVGEHSPPHTLNLFWSFVAEYHYRHCMLWSDTTRLSHSFPNASRPSRIAMCFGTDSAISSSLYTISSLARNQSRLAVTAQHKYITFLIYDRVIATHILMKSASGKCSITTTLTDRIRTAKLSSLQSQTDNNLTHSNDTHCAPLIKCTASARRQTRSILSNAHKIRIRTTTSTLNSLGDSMQQSSEWFLTNKQGVHVYKQPSSLVGIQVLQELPDVAG